MPTEAKRATVAELAEQLGSSKAAIVSDYRGLSVADISALRGGLRDQGVVYRVVKNRLMKIAAQQAGRPELAELLDGPSAIAFGSGDESATAKAFVDAVRRYRQVAIRGAVLGEQRIDEAGLRRLASLPPREVLLAQLAGALQSPLSTTAGLLVANIRNLGSALRQLESQRTEAAGSTGS
jgi:large subunit ribosomal protein L10